MFGFINRFCLRFASLASPLLAINAVPAVAQPSADFELRLGADHDDAIMVLGSPTDGTLDLEIWVRVNDAAGSSVTGYTFFLNADSTGVVEIAQISDFEPAPFFNIGAAESGTDNLPDTGDFGRLVLAAPPGTPEGIGSFAHFGTVTLTAADVGTVGYIFDEIPPDGQDPVGRPWSVNLFPFATIDSSNLTFDILPEVTSIQVVLEPELFISDADADNDADVDLVDYCMLQGCATEDGTPASPECMMRDLNNDQLINDDDVAAMVPRMTGPLDPAGPGDIDHDGDIDLKDYQGYQRCMGRAATPGFVEMCKLADIDGDFMLTDADFMQFWDMFTGPQ